MSICPGKDNLHQRIEPTLRYSSGRQIFPEFLRMRLFIHCLSLVVVTFPVVAQSPWVAGKGKGYAQLGFTGIGPYNSLFSEGSGVYRLVREVSDRTLQIYGEYGVRETTSLLAILPYKMLATGNLVDNPTPDTGGVIITEGTFSTLGNVQLALRQNFLSEGVVFSGQFTVELPTAGFDETMGLRGGLNAISVVPSFSVGMGTSRVYGFVSTGVALRSNNYSSEFRLGGEIGLRVISRVYVCAVLDIVSNFEDGNASEDFRQLQTGLYLNNQGFFAYGLKTIIGFTDKIGINAAFYGAGSGNLVARSPSVNAGFYVKW